ncbi:MAG: peptidase M28, partial [Gemmatimonadaceae bacterium]|nr:peptidase M28 [Gemmatimonadaceae bacterium]
MRLRLATIALGALACAPRVSTSPASAAIPPALAEIDTARLRRDLFALAGDAMRGREAGTLDELRASAWVADRAREAGLQPAGDDGTYFQFWPMRRIRLAESSTAALDGAPLALWRDAAVVAPVNATADLPLVWVGSDTGAALAGADVKGKAVAAVILPPARPPVSWVSLRPWRYTRQAIAERTAALTAAGAAAIVLVADDSTDTQFVAVSTPMRRGSYAPDSAGAERVPSRV